MIARRKRATASSLGLCWLLVACGSPSAPTTPAAEPPDREPIMPAMPSAPPPPRSAPGAGPAPTLQPPLRGPTPTGDEAPGAPPRSLTRAEQAMNQLRAPLRQCYQQELQQTPDLQGSIGAWTIEVDSEGTIRRVSLPCFGLPPRMKPCVESAIKRLSFEPGERTLSGGSCP